MKLAIRFINALFQQADKIIDKVAVKVEGVPQVVGDIVNIALNVTAIQVERRFGHGNGMEKGFGVKVIVLQERLKRSGSGGLDMRLMRFLVFVIGQFVSIHAVVSQRHELGKVILGRIRPSVSNGQCTIILCNTGAELFHLFFQTLMGDILTDDQKFIPADAVQFSVT